jgi:hypothetical protein
MKTQQTAYQEWRIYYNHPAQKRRRNGTTVFSPAGILAADIYWIADDS